MSPSPDDCDPLTLRAAVLEAAARLGFHRVGITAADSERRHAAYRAWLAADYHGDMAYLSEPRLVEARRDCEAIAANARTVICVALAYDPSDPSPTDDVLRGRVARYARGEDYHPLIKERLGELADALSETVGQPVAARPVTDSAPLLERAMAERAGLGFIGKNTMLISPGLGSYTLLGELLTTVEISPTPTGTNTSHCGECRLCLDACPTDALPAPFVLDARRCISYLTIEHRGSIALEHRAALSDMVFGCDICQDVCPYNAKAPSRTTPEPRLSGADINAARPPLHELLALRSSGWKRLTRNRSIRRATRDGLVRNAAVATGNIGDSSSIEALMATLQHNSPMVIEHAAWALESIAQREREASEQLSVPLTSRPYNDDDWTAICEIHDLARILELADNNLVAAFLSLQMTAKPEGLFDGRLRVACLADHVVGFVAFTDVTVDADQSDSEISWLYVHPRFHGNGIGRFLLREAMSRIADKVIGVSVLAGNHRAIGLYQSEGFVITETRSGKLSGNESFPAQGHYLERTNEVSTNDEKTDKL